MLVKYIGRNNIFTVEYNGKRFCFRKGGDPMDIPLQAYDMIKRSGHMDAQNVIPVQEISNVTIVDNPETVKENEALKIRVEELENENKKLNDRLLRKREKSDAKKK